MEILELKYYRARLSAFKDFISQAGQSKDKNSPHELLKYGVIHGDLENDFVKHVSKISEEYTFSEKPLEFSELCSFNTWFAMHPEKIAGKELITTSREFPITIKGTKEDIIKTISQNTEAGIDKQQRIRISKAKALAKLKLLQITTI